MQQQLLKTDTVDVVKTRNSRKLAAETNAGRLDDAQGRVAEAQALEGLNSMPKFSEANADDAKRAANAAEDVFDANDAHEDIASTKAEVARANRIAELTLKPNKTKAEEAELRELKREELSPLQKQIIKIRTHKDYEDLSSKQKQKLVDDLIRTDASSGSVLPPGVYPGNSAGYNLITGQPNQMMQTQNTSDTIRTNVEQNLKNTVDIRVTGDQSKESVENRDMSFGQKFSRHHKNSAGKFEYQFGISTHEAALAEARLIMQDNEYAIKATWNAMFKQYDNLPQDIKDKVSRMTYDTDGEQYILDLFNSGDALSRMARHGLRFAGEPMGNLHLTTQIDAAGNITYLVRKPYEKGWGLYLARPDASGAAYYGAITDASAGQGSAWDGSCFGQPGPDGLHSHTSSYSREVITVNNTVFNTISSQYIYTTPPDYVPPGYRLVCDESTGLYGLLAVNINIQKNVQQEVQWLDDGRRSPKQRPVEKKAKFAQNDE
jgi:hypothetical protein